MLHGWRLATIDVDIKLVPDHDVVLRAIPALKESMRLNIELAAPDDFIPVRDGRAFLSELVSQSESVCVHRHTRQSGLGCHPALDLFV